MVVIFVALSVLPLLVLYGFSLDFLKRGVDSWFDARIDQALEDALDLSRNALDLRTRELLAQTETLAGEVARGPRRDSMLDLSAFSVNALHDPDNTIVAEPWEIADSGLDALRHRVKAEELTVVSGDGGLIETSNAGPEFVPTLPTAAMLLQLRQGRSYIGLEPLSSGGLLVRVAVNIPDMGVSSPRRILHALYALSPRINALTSNVEHAYARYNELDNLGGLLLGAPAFRPNQRAGRRNSRRDRRGLHHHFACHQQRRDRHARELFQCNDPAYRGRSPGNRTAEPLRQHLAERTELRRARAGRATVNHNA
jgi:hypothetical protein